MDEFKIVTCDAMHWMTAVKGIIVVKDDGLPKYYLGNDYHFHTFTNHWIVGCATFVKKSICKIEANPGLGGYMYDHLSPLPEN